MGYNKNFIQIYVKSKKIMIDAQFTIEISQISNLIFMFILVSSPIF